MAKFNKVAIVNLIDDYNKKDYGFALYDEDMNEIVKYDTNHPLYVIVNARGKDNRVLGILKEVKSVEAYGKGVTAQIVGVVNMMQELMRKIVRKKLQSRKLLLRRN